MPRTRTLTMNRQPLVHFRAMDELSIQGTLDEATVPDLVRSMIRSGETAVLILERNDRVDRIYLLDGHIVFASSSDPDYGVAEVLLRTGDINLENYRNLVGTVANSRRIGAALCELGYLQPDELLGAYERQVSLIVMQTLGFRDGGYRIEFTGDFGPDVMTLPMKTERLIMDGMTSIQHWSLIQRGLGNLDRMLKQSSRADARIFRMELSEDESHVFSMLAEPLPISTIVQRSYLSNFVTCRTLWALQAVDLLEEAESTQVDEQRAAVEDAIEVESNVERYNAVFQALFRLVFQRIGDYTWDFVDRVVQHLSPSVMPLLGGINLVNEGRVDFDQLMNNLIASGESDPRTVMYGVLNELLYGWIYEIKTEFSGDMDARVNQVMRGLRDPARR
ncbi:MAG: DUF4388 domain-containing protein [Acidobacteriota bacterium]